MTAQLDRDIFGNLLSRREASGARRYYHFDGVGSTTALTNESGAATSTLLYDAWGNQRAATGSDQGRYRFTGAELDAATGLYHMHARFYDPTIGRWLSEDPVQDKYFEPATLNLYAYVANNPLAFVDPKGTTTESSNVQGTNPDSSSDEQKRIDKILEEIAQRWGVTKEKAREILTEIFGIIEANLSRLAGIIGTAAALVALGVCPRNRPGTGPKPARGDHWHCRSTGCASLCWSGGRRDRRQGCGGYHGGGSGACRPGSSRGLCAGSDREDLLERLCEHRSSQRTECHPGTRCGQGRADHELANAVSHSGSASCGLGAHPRVHNGSLDLLLVATTRRLEAEGD